MDVRKVARARWVCQEIARDCEADARRFEGQPFNRWTVAEYFGVIGAQIAALAEVVDELLREAHPSAPEACEYPPAETASVQTVRTSVFDDLGEDCGRSCRYVIDPSCPVHRRG